jgi:dTDP-4-dehydrorhamnose reductase
MKILVLGAGGMLGHIVCEYFTEAGYEVVVTTRNESDKNYYDAYKNIYGIEKIIEVEKPQIVINCIGVLNQAAEDNHALASLLNSFLPNYLDTLSEKYKYKLIHVTTDCVFDGKKGDYTELDFPDAKTYYGLSKALGEVNNNRTLTLRTSIVGPDRNQNGIGLFKWFVEQTGTIKGFDGVIWTGVTTLQLAKVMEEGIKKNLSGLYHAVNGEKISKHNLLKLFQKYFNNEVVIEKESDTISDKSLVLSDGSYRFDIPSYSDMVSEMSDWIMSHPDMYPELIGKVVKK